MLRTSLCLEHMTNGGCLSKERCAYGKIRCFNALEVLSMSAQRQLQTDIIGITFVRAIKVENIYLESKCSPN